jgi:hypothetical protein
VHGALIVDNEHVAMAENHILQAQVKLILEFS